MSECPYCHRQLLSHNSPNCSWCGKEIADQNYQNQAAAGRQAFFAEQAAHDAASLANMEYLAMENNSFGGNTFSPFAPQFPIINELEQLAAMRAAPRAINPGFSPGGAPNSAPNAAPLFGQAYHEEPAQTPAPEEAAEEAPGERFGHLEL